jgi:uncharacterized membrane protein YcaP (DUF421 family)
METVLRVAVIYLFVLVGLRVLGKREFGQLSPLELVTLLMIPEIVSQALTRDDYSLTNALIGVSTLFVLVFLTSVLVHRFKKLELAVSGAPTVLVSRGELRHEALDTNRVTTDELFSEMHKSGLDELKQVKWAILEPDGHIAIVPIDEVRLTPASNRGTKDNTIVG